MDRIDVKTLILLCLLAILSLLFVANQSLSSNEVLSTLDVRLNSSSNWTQLRLEGATITGMEILDPGAHIDHSDSSMLMEGPGNARIKPIIKVIRDPVKFYLSKDLMGRASAEIKGIGRLENLHQPVTIPISIITNSSLAKIRLDGMIIEKSIVKNMKGAASRPIITESSIALANPLSKEVELDLLVKASLYDEFPIIVLEKEDKGTLQAQVGNYAYSNNKTGKRTVRDLPVTVETTSNMTQIFFEGAEISKGKIIQIDNQSLQTSIIGDDFVFLKYDHDGTVFNRASFLLDLNYSQGDRLNIYKNNSGFAGVKVGDRSYFLANSSKTDSYVSQSYSLKDLQGGENPEMILSAPLVIETTSDWTEISLQGLDEAEIVVSRANGNISSPVVSDGIITIKKAESEKSENPSLVRVEAVIRAKRQDEGRIKIEKGDHGYTLVKIGEFATYNNIGVVEGDSRNSRQFQLPPLPRAEADSNVSYNPAAFIFPVYAELNDQGMTIEDTQPKEVSLSISEEEIPGKGMHFSIPMAEGVRVYAFIALLILLIFSAAVLRLEVRLGLSETSYRDAIWSQLEELGRLQLSSTLIIEALVALAVVPLILIKAGAIAPLVILIIYLVLAAALIIRLAGIRKRQYMDAKEWAVAKRETFSALLAAAAYFGLFVLLMARPAIGPNISRLLLLGTAGSLCLLYLFLVHPNRRTYREALWRQAVSNLEGLPISSVIILEALICLALIPFLLLSIEAIADGAAVLAYLLLVAGVAIRFGEMKSQLSMDKQKEILIKILCLGVLPAAGILGAFELMKINPGAGRILFILIVMAVALFLAFIYLYLRRKSQN